MKKAVVLLSGGLDSAVALYLAISKGYECHCLTIDYAQRSREEIERAKNVVSIAKCEHTIIRIEGTKIFDSALTDPLQAILLDRTEEEIEKGPGTGYVQARNLIFCSLALALAEKIGAFDIFTGFYADTSMPDTNRKFCRAFERAAQKSTIAGRQGKKFRLHSYHDANKYGVAALGLELGAPLYETISCLDPKEGKACGHCDSCTTRKAVFDELGVTDPAELGGISE